MSNFVTVVFCKDQDAINKAIQNWVNVKGYSLVSQTEGAYEAAHFVPDGAGGYSRNDCTHADEFRIALVFEGD